MKSFSSKIKEELSKLNNLAKKDLVKAELSGYLSTTKSNKFATSSEYNINRFSKLLSNSGEDNYTIKIEGKNFVIKTKNKIDVNEEVDSEDKAKAMARGAFMASGSVSNPNKEYHLEIVFADKENLRKVNDILNSYLINSKVIARKNEYIIYLKDAEGISNFLAFIGANNSVLEFEEARTLKEVKNNINRQVNYETANLNKTISASVKQIEDIKLIKKKKKFDKLSEGERALAEARLKNPNSTLSELGKLVTPNISKSGVTHRLENIAKLANELR